MKHLILYFSATGNSLEVAKELAEGIGECRIEDLMSMDLSNGLEGFETIGFVYPCYFLSTPEFVLDKIGTLNLPKTAYYYGVCTVNKYDGNAGRQLSDTLAGKGIKLSYYKRLVMVGNYIMMYDISSKKKQEKLLKKARGQYKEIIETIQSRTEIEVGNKMEWFAQKYYEFFESQKTSSEDKFHVTDECIGCGLCEKVCKFDNIEMQGRLPVWYDKCEHCTACLHWCPKQAVQYGKRTEKRDRYTNPTVTVSELMK